jgi:serine/threonine-protein kinase
MKSIKLRKKPMDVDYEHAREIFNLSSRWNPVSFTIKDYEIKEGCIIDHASGLLWQKSGSDLVSIYEIDSYIIKLNDEKYGGYTGWRLPTTEELLSLIEPEKQSNGLFISPLFDTKQTMCWGADSHKGYRWNVYYDKKRVFSDIKVSHYIRAVRDVDVF